MKRNFLILSFLTIFAGYVSASESGYEIRVKVKGIRDSTCQLAYYFGDKQYIKDSAKADANGLFVFKGEEKLPGGIYMAVVPGKRYFEFIVDNIQKFSLETDTLNFIENMKVSNSSENSLFYDYLKWITAKGKEMEDLQKQAEIAKDDKKTLEKIREKQKGIDSEVKAYKNKFISDNPKLLLSKVFLASEEPEIPEAPVINGKKDSTFPFRYYKSHFFDKVDMKDDRLLRSPVFGNKIKQYIEKLTLQVPDSISKAADYVIGLADPNGEIFKYLVYYITNSYEKSQIMGMDAIFVYMAKNYYLSGKAYWVDSTQLEKICDRVKALEPCLLGRKANPMTGLLNEKIQYTSLNDIKNKFTIVYFWDPSCGHCQKVTPKLKEFYDANRRKLNLEILAVYIEADTVEWFKYIKEKQLTWKNAADLTGTANFRRYYDIYSTPVIYLLDNEKRIIAKRIEVDQLEDFLNNYEKGKIATNKLPDWVPYPCKGSPPSKDKH